MLKRNYDFLNIIKHTWQKASEQQTDLKRVVWIWRGVESARRGGQTREEKHPPILPVQTQVASPRFNLILFVLCQTKHASTKIQQTAFHFALNCKSKTFHKSLKKRIRSMQVTKNEMSRRSHGGTLRNVSMAYLQAQVLSLKEAICLDNGFSKRPGTHLNSRL